MKELSRESPLAAVSPLDGRYAGRTADLVPYASEAALIEARLRVEVEYLLALADHESVDCEVTSEERAHLREVVDEFDADDAALVKRIETEGAAGFAATNHDVKAVEYFLRTETPERLHPWIHFGLTSEDVNNLANRLNAKGAVEDVLLPAIEDVRASLTAMAREHRDVPMLARTHGQPATPTTFGKEMAVFAA
ncbi:lyase family protein, partial [Halolamina salina]